VDRALDVGGERVPDVDDVAQRDTELLRRPHEDLRAGLGEAEDARVGDDLEAIAPADLRGELGEAALGVGDDADGDGAGAEGVDDLDHPRDRPAPEVRARLLVPQPVDGHAAVDRGRLGEGEQLGHQHLPRVAAEAAPDARVVGPQRAGQRRVEARLGHVEAALGEAAREHARVELAEGLAKVEGHRGGRAYRHAARRSTRERAGLRVGSGPSIMRSRPDLKLYLIPGAIEPGTRFRAEAELVSRSTTPIDGVEFHLIGKERRHVRTSMVGNSPSPVYHEITHVDLVARTPATTLVKGPHRVAVKFDLPRRCPPAYGSNVTTIHYDLVVRVAIPWWPDRSERYLINVVAEPSLAQGEPASFCSDGAGPQGKALYLEASLDSAVIDHGGAVRGAVSVANVEHHRIRRIEAALVVSERALDHSVGVHEVQRYVLTLREGAPIEGEALPFFIKIPAQAPPSFRSSLIEVGWHLVLRAVVTLGKDVSLAIPIQVVRRSEGAPREAESPARVPPVGRERRALVWAESARRHGLVNDASEERMALDLGSDAALTISLEQRKAGGLVYTATVAWPRLGIDLAVTERRWVDAWSRDGITLDVPGFADRFTARAREPAQVRAFLDAAEVRALLLFEEAAVGDEGATLVSAGTAQSVEDLDAFVARAVAAARTLAQGTSRIPPPAAMAAFVPAWRAFAGALGGRLALGGMAIVDAAFDQAPLQITTAWTDEGAPRATRLRLPITPRDGATLTASEFALDPAARALMESLSAQAPSLEIRADAVEATLPAPLADPASIEPLLTGMARLARLLGGGAARGPYR
jgi:hypothetical protein